MSAPPHDRVSRDHARGAAAPRQVARAVPAASNQSDLRSGAQSTLLYIVVELSLRPTKVKAHPLP